jgi:hypothetical protein
MKKWLLAVRLVLLISMLPSLATAQSYLVSFYANNDGPASVADQTLRLINVGQLGTPLTTPVGDICANIYVFDNSQQMTACCSCRLKANGLTSASVAKQLTNNPLTPIIPSEGVIKILPIIAGTAACSAIAPFASPDASLIEGFSTHVEITGPARFITETRLAATPLGRDEAAFLSNACFFVRYLGSSAYGTCGCTTPGH